jgi:RNA polymerase sigma-70 factor, ECF subfamily
VQDAQLLDLLRQADKKSENFSVLVDLYKKRIYGIVRKMVISHDDADDVVQETFVKVWQNLDNFKSESNLFTWIYRIATNESLQFLRKRKRLSWGNSVLVEALQNSLTSDAYFDGDELQLKLQKAILQLPDKQRLVFNLKYYDDLTYDQISEITETTVGALKASYHHAVKKIEEYVQED